MKVGIFICLGIALFCAGLFLIGSTANLFGAHFVVYTQFNDVNSISKGATVRVAGMDAGQVAGIGIPASPSGQFRLKLSVDKKFRPIVREDSVASIKTEGFVGNQFINIAKGTAKSPECRPGCTLPSQEATSMGELMRKGSALVGQIQGTIKRADVAVDNFASVGKNVNGMIVAMKPKVARITGNADAIVAGIRNGQGTAGKLLTDKSVAANVAGTIANAKQASANFAQTSQKVNRVISGVQQNDMPGVHKTVQNTQQLTGRLNKAVGSFVGSKKTQNTANAVQQTIEQAQQATGNLADDTEALKTNFFFRGFFNRRGFYNLSALTPDKYESSRFATHPNARVWISAADLFASGPDGSPQLKDAGRQVLDRRMSALFPYLPHNPIMVEGYSTAAAPDQQYLTSRQRAIDVRNYLIQQFHLDPKFVGFIPLSSHPPKKAGKRTWDGICLVLVEQKPRHGLF